MEPVAAQTMEVTSFKSLAESPVLSSVLSAYAFNINPNEEADPNDAEFTIPIVHMSLLTLGSPDQRSQIIHDLVKNCQEWGFFILSIKIYSTGTGPSVNNKATRISIAIPHGPSVDTIIAPALELLEKEGQAPKYIGMNYKEYIQLQQIGKNYMQSTFDHILA
ncbi:hypothetical protein ACFX15_029363 [Malus domestica]